MGKVVAVPHTASLGLVGCASASVKEKLLAEVYGDGGLESGNRETHGAAARDSGTKGLEPSPLKSQTRKASRNQVQHYPFGNHRLSPQGPEDNPFLNFLFLLFPRSWSPVSEQENGQLL
jgi:hypothetical protein